MGWFSKKPKGPDADKFLQLYDEGVAAFYKGDLQGSINMLLGALKAIEYKASNLSAEAWCYIGIAEMQLFDEEERAGKQAQFLDGESRRLSNAVRALLSA